VLAWVRDDPVRDLVAIASAEKAGAEIEVVRANAEQSVLPHAFRPTLTVASAICGEAGS
jgi:hypothetical protein